MVLHRELAGQGYEGSYAAVAKVRVAVAGVVARTGGKVDGALRDGSGEQSQVDWGSTWVYLGEARTRVHVFTMVLGYSRRLFARAYANEGLEALLEGHAEAFAHFGVARPRSSTTTRGRSSRRRRSPPARVVWNASFKDRMDFYGVEVKLCRYYRAQTKGQGESGVKYVKGNALAGRRFRDLEDLNTYLLDWCRGVADGAHPRDDAREAVGALARAETLISVAARWPSPRERVESRSVRATAMWR